MHFETTGNPNVLFVESTQEAGRGNFYRLAVERGAWRCTCPGFRFRRHCKHSYEADALFPRPQRPAPARTAA